MTDKYDPPDPIDASDAYKPDKDTYGKPDKPTYGTSYQPYIPATDYGTDYYPPNLYDKPGYDAYKPPEKPDYGTPPGYDTPDKTEYKPDKPGYYEPPKKPEYDAGYTPDVVYPTDPTGSSCKSNNVCEKKGYKCCACADCTSDSFGCAETCACCPKVSTRAGP